MNRVRPFLLTTALLFFMFPASGWAEYAEADSAQAVPNVLRVSFNELPPWKILTEDGVPDGIDIRFLELVAERMQLSLQFHPMPFKRGLAQLELGKIDLMIGVLRRPERETYAHFIEPPYKTRSNKAFFVLKGKEDAIARHEDLHTKVIGTQLGGRYYPSFDKDTNIVKDPVSSTNLNIKMLLAGRIDAYITTEVSGEYWIRKHGLTDRIAKARFVYSAEQPVHAVLSRRSPLAPRVDEFNRVVAELLEAGEFERVRDEFLAQQWN